MLSMPTLWLMFAINLLGLGLGWLHVVRRYPDFVAARYWAAATIIGAAGVGMAMLRGVLADPRAPMLLGSALELFACCLVVMGVRRYFEAPAPWRSTFWICTLTLAGLAYFLLVQVNMPARIVVYSLGQSVAIALALRHLMARRNAHGRDLRLVGAVGVAMLIVHVLRCADALLLFGGDMTPLNFNPVQAVLGLMLMCLTMAGNCGLLLMTLDRLRNDVAVLALRDDLTGIANRRHLQRRLSEECELSRRSREPFALLAVDLDGFKSVNDSFGHAAGDDILRHFTIAVQERLRPGDLLARIGGDEFAVLLPATTRREAAMMARRVLDASRAVCVAVEGGSVGIAASIGVAQWTEAIGLAPDRLVAEADHALYAAKNAGKNGYAVYEQEADGVVKVGTEMPEPERKRA